MSGLASATIIGSSSAGIFIDDMNPADLSSTGWVSVACATCAKGSTTSGLLTQGPGGGDPPGDGNYLKAKDNQNTGFWIAAPDAFGSTTCTNTTSCIATTGDLSHFDGDQIYFTAAFLGNTQQFGQGFGVGFGNVVITGGTGCTVNTAGGTGCFSLQQDFGTVNGAGTFYLFSGSFSRGAFTEVGTGNVLTLSQWADVLKNIKLITIDVSTHTTNSNDSIGIDEFGFTTTPEPATFGLIGSALVAGIYWRRLRCRR